MGWIADVSGLTDATNAAKEHVAKLWTDLRRYVAIAVRIVSFFTASISSFFIGLFLSVGGLDYFLLIDKRTMIASLFVYTAILSAITVIVSFVPLLVTKNEAFGWFVRLAGFVGFLLTLIGLEYALALLLFAAALLLWMRLRGAHKDILNLLTVALLCCLASGYLRGEHLRERQPSMQIHLVDTGKAVPVTIIMSSDQGVLVFEREQRDARFYPWSRVAWMSAVSSPGGFGPWLRDRREAVRAWVGESAAAAMKLMGWGASSRPK